MGPAYIPASVGNTAPERQKTPPFLELIFELRRLGCTPSFPRCPTERSPKQHALAHCSAPSPKRTTHSPAADCAKQELRSAWSSFCLPRSSLAPMPGVGRKKPAARRLGFNAAELDLPRSTFIVEPGSADDEAFIECLRMALSGGAWHCESVTVQNARIPAPPRGTVRLRRTHSIHAMRARPNRPARTSFCHTAEISSKLSDEQTALLHLPQRMGGMGLTS
jgi:hypothetical protein